MNEEENYDKLVVKNFKFSIIKEKSNKKSVVSKMFFYMFGAFLLISLLFLDNF